MTFYLQINLRVSLSRWNSFRCVSFAHNCMWFWNDERWRGTHKDRQSEAHFYHSGQEKEMTEWMFRFDQAYLTGFVSRSFSLSAPCQLNRQRGQCEEDEEEEEIVSDAQCYLRVRSSIHLSAANLNGGISERERVKSSVSFSIWSLRRIGEVLVRIIQWTFSLPMTTWRTTIADADGHINIPSINQCVQGVKTIESSSTSAPSPPFQQLMQTTDRWAGSPAVSLLVSLSRCRRRCRSIRTRGCLCAAIYTLIATTNIHLVASQLFSPFSSSHFSRWIGLKTRRVNQWE